MLIFQTRTLCTILEVLYHFLAARLSLWIVYWTAAKTVIYWVAFHCGIQTRTVWSLYRCCCCLVTKSCPSLCNPMDCNTPAFLVLHYLPEFAKTHVHRVDDAIQPHHPLSLPSSSALNLSQHGSLLQWVSSLHQISKGLEIQLQHQSFQWIFRVDFL